MASPDSGFARLAQAWHAAARTPLSELAARGIKALGIGLSSRALGHGVIWIAAGQTRSDPPAAVTSLATHHNYRVSVLRAATVDDLAQTLRRDCPRLIVADVDWCGLAGPGALRDLRRHAPSTDWLLLWDEPSPRWLEILVATGARGAVEHGADDVALGRAFDAVATGELWLPRRVMKWLYATIIEATATGGPSTVSSSSWPADSELTPRETEVAELMRHGLTNREIADRLGVSVNTVKKHLASAYAKMGIRSRRQVVG